MKSVLLTIALFSLSLSVTGQVKPRATSRIKRPPAAAVQASADPAAEGVELDDAVAAASSSDKIAALQTFLKKHPESPEKTRALESLASARAALGDERFEAGDPSSAVAIFKQAVSEAPRPFSDRFFAEVVSRIPGNLYLRGSRDEAIAAAAEIEKGVGTNTNQLLVLANFYLSIENPSEALRIADAALKATPDSPAAHLLKANAQRMNFDLDAASRSYATALSLAPDLLAAKRGLAEMNRALGKPNDSVDIYRQILDKTPDDPQARTGLIMALFDAGKRQDAEAEMAKAMEGGGNVVLLSQIAYWYASHNEAAKAVDLGRRAVAMEPRYIWSHLALARGLLGQQNPVEAEHVLINARRYGNFPTLEYEIANARVMAGFYREAAEELAKSFAVVDGGVETRLGGRVSKRETTLPELIARERLASIFEPATPDTAETAERLRALLDLHQKLEAGAIDEAAVTAAADAFLKGDDKMSAYRQLYVANALVEKRTALAKALELTKLAIANTDAAMEAPNISAAVMANELYDSRSLAFARGEYLLVPDVPKQTLSAILRGRIEEIAGWALYSQNNYADAAIRLRRAISVYPPKSAWLRSALWRLGSALQADGKDAEALDAYIKSYKTDKPDAIRYSVIEALYRKLNGGVDGLEAQIGANPQPTVITSMPDTAAASIKTGTIGAPPNAVSASVPSKIESAPAPLDPTAVTAKEPTVSETPAAAIDPKLPEKKAIIDPSTPEPARIEPANSEIKNGGSPRASQQNPETAEPQNSNPNSNPIDAKTTVETPAPAAIQTSEPPQVGNIASAVERADPQQTNVPTEKAPDEKPLSEPAANASVSPSTRTVSSMPVEATGDRALKQNDLGASVINADLPAATPLVSKPPEHTGSVIQHQAPKVVITDLTLPKPVKKPTVSKLEAANRPLFEPIIISAPAASSSERSPTNRPPDGRPRVVEGVEIKADDPEPCKLTVSDDNVSVINGGGSVGVRVRVVGPDENAEIVATSASPQNVEVRRDAGITDGRRFYIIRSISLETGLFNVKFAAACGQLTVPVKVR